MYDVLEILMIMLMITIIMKSTVDGASSKFIADRKNVNGEVKFNF